MKRQKQWLVSIVGALTALTINSVTWAGGVVPLDNRLPAWEDYGPQTVDFTHIDINYSNGKGKGNSTSGNDFFGESTSSSFFSLNSIVDGYSDVGFNGYLVIDANISSKGVLRSGGTFSIYSTDAMFAGYETDYNCTKSGYCSTGNLVYGGTLTGFGWSGSQGVLEFSIGALHGWAVDHWTPGGGSEHILLDVGQFTLNDVSSVKSFRATADGFAVVGFPMCGNWILESGEQCDDGNNVDGDGCSAVCTIESYCGDGNTDIGEQCDDGNNVDGDGCSAVCTNEP